MTLTRRHMILAAGSSVLLSACDAPSSEGRAPSLSLLDVVTISGFTVDASQARAYSSSDHFSDNGAEWLSSALQSALNSAYRGLGSGSEKLVIQVRVLGAQVPKTVIGSGQLQTMLSSNGSARKFAGRLNVTTPSWESSQSAQESLNVVVGQYVEEMGALLRKTRTRTV